MVCTKRKVRKLSVAFLTFITAFVLLQICAVASTVFLETDGQIFNKFSGTPICSIVRDFEAVLGTGALSGMLTQP